MSVIPLIETPRKLTPDEINDILSVISEVKSSIDIIRSINTKSLINTLKIQLSTIKIVPLPEALLLLKNNIRNSYAKALITPGTPVGMTAGEALSAPLTQSNLNTFHRAGTATNVSGGINAFNEILNGSPNRSSPASTIVFKDPFITFDQILEQKRNRFIEVNIGMLIQEYDIETPENLFPAIGNIIERPKWYSDFIKFILKNPLPNSNYILRLTINPNLLYRHQIIPRDVANSIDIHPGINVTSVYSPILLKSEDIEVIRENKIMLVKTKVPKVYIDIYPHDNKITKLPTIPIQTKSLFYLNTAVRNSLDRIYLKGVKGIKDMFPVESTVWQIVQTEVKESNSDIWQLWYDMKRIKITGISIDNLKQLCILVRMNIIDEVILSPLEQYLRVILPPNLPITGDKQPEIKKPGDLVDYYKSKDSKEAREYEKTQQDKYNELSITDPIAASKLIIHRPLTDIQKMSTFIYADTNGSNLVDTFLLDDVDPYHTYSNNMYEILFSLGIEAVRNFIILELTRMIESGGNYIDPRHTVLIGDFMCHNGIITKMTFHGNRKQPVGTFAQSSFEQAGKVITDAALFGARDPITSVSSSIFVGKRANIGTGYNQFYIDKSTEVKINNMASEKEQIDITDFKNAIDTGITASYGITPVNMSIQQGFSLEELFGSVGKISPPSVPPLIKPIGLVTIGKPPVPPRTRVEPLVVISSTPPDSHDIIQPTLQNQIYPKPIISSALIKVAETVTTSVCLPPTDEERKTFDIITVKGKEPPIQMDSLPLSPGEQELDVKMGPTKVAYLAQQAGGTTPDTLSPVLDVAGRTDLDPIPIITIPLPTPKEKFVDLSQYI